MSVFGQLAGVNTVSYYAPTIVSSAGLGASAAILATAGVGVVNVVMTVVGMTLVDKTGRRILLMIGLLQHHEGELIRRSAMRTHQDPGRRGQAHLGRSPPSLSARTFAFRPARGGFDVRHE